MPKQKFSPYSRCNTYNSSKNSLEKLLTSDRICLHELRNSLLLILGRHTKLSTDRICRKKRHKRRYQSVQDYIRNVQMSTTKNVANYVFKNRDQRRKNIG